MYDATKLVLGFPTVRCGRIFPHGCDKLICVALQIHLSSCVVPVLIVILSVLALQQICASDVASVEATTISTPPISMRLLERPRSSAHGSLSF